MFSARKLVAELVAEYRENGHFYNKSMVWTPAEYQHMLDKRTNLMTHFLCFVFQDCKSS